VDLGITKNLKIQRSADKGPGQTMRASVASWRGCTQRDPAVTGKWLEGPGQHFFKRKLTFGGGDLPVPCSMGTALKSQARRFEMPK